MPRIPLRILLAVPALAVLMMTACGKKPMAPAPDADVVTEPSNAEAATLGPEGGRIITTASDGTEYVLEVPENALLAPVRIVVTPVRQWKNVAFPGGLAGAVDFQPSGLVLARAAQLRIKTSKLPPAGTRAVGVAGRSSGAPTGLRFAGSAPGEIVVPISHFSIGGAFFGTTTDVSTIQPAFSDSLDRVAGALTALTYPADRAEAVSRLRVAANQFVIPDLEGASNDEELLAALTAYDKWRLLIDAVANDGNPPVQPLSPPGAPPAPIPHVAIPELATEIDAAIEAAADALLSAIVGNDITCSDQASLVALGNIFFWHRYAELLGVADVAHALDLGTVMANLCARVELVEQTLPPSLQVGFPQDVDLRFGVRFGNGTLVDAPFHVDLSGTNVSLLRPSGNTDATGFFTSGVVANAAGPVGIEAAACLILPGRTRPSPVCATFPITGNSEDPPTGVDLSGVWQLALQGESCPFVGGSSGSVTITQTGNAIHGDWSTIHMCGIGLEMSGTMSATLALDSDGHLQLLNVSLVVAHDSRESCVGIQSPYEGTMPGTLSPDHNGISAPVEGQSGTECANLIRFSILMSR